MIVYFYDAAFLNFSIVNCLLEKTWQLTNDFDNRTQNTVQKDINNRFVDNFS